MQPVQARARINRRRMLGTGLAGLLVASLFTTGGARADDEEPRAIFVMQRDGTNVRHVVSLKDVKTLGNPSWSHDGKQCAFDAKGSGNSRLFTIGMDGKNLVDLSEGAMPTWSPDDKQLAFHAVAGTKAPAGAAADVWVQNVDGKGRVRLAEGMAPRWSSDGSQIAMAGKALRIFDMIETKQHDVFQSSEKIGSTVGFDWSPDGKRLAAIIERNGGRELVIVSADASDKQITPRLRGNFHDIAWSPRGDLLATSIQDEKSGQRKLYLLSAEGNDPATLIVGQEGGNREPSWSPDGTQLAFASSRKTGGRPALAMGPLSAKLELVKKHDPGGETYSLAFMPDGQSALLGGGLLSRQIQVWDFNTDKVRKIEMGTWIVAVSPDGRRAAVAPSHTRIIKTLDMEDGGEVNTFTHGAMVVLMQFSHDGSKLASTGEDLCACIFDVTSGDLLFRMPHDGQVCGVKWSPDDKLLGVACVDKKLHLWDTGTGKKVRAIDHNDTPYSVAFSPDGTRVITGTGGEAVSQVLQLNYTPQEVNPVCVWDVASGKLIREMTGHEWAVFGVEYSPDGKFIASASFDGTVRLWDAERGVELDQMKGEGFATKAVFSPDGSHLLVAGGVKRTFNPGETIFNSSFWKPVPDERVRLLKIVAGPATTGDK